MKAHPQNWRLTLEPQRPVSLPPSLRDSLEKSQEGQWAWRISRKPWMTWWPTRHQGRLTLEPSRPKRLMLDQHQLLYHCYKRLSCFSLPPSENFITKDEDFCLPPAEFFQNIPPCQKSLPVPGTRTFIPVLGIRDILVRIWIPGSVSPDPYLWLMDPTPFFIEFEDAKKNIFFQIHFFLLTCAQVHRLQSKKFNFLLKFCVQMLFCRHYFSPLNTFMRKGKEPDPDPHLLTNGSGSGRPKNMRIRIPNTALYIPLCRECPPVLGARPCTFPMPEKSGSWSEIHAEPDPPHCLNILVTILLPSS